MNDVNANSLQLRSNKSKNFQEDEMKVELFHQRNKSFNNMTEYNECRSEISEGLRFDLDNDPDFFNQTKSKKDPQNKHFNFFYEIPLYCKNDFVFEFKGDMSKQEFTNKTTKIRKYPSHLKNTLFVNEEIKDFRKKDFSFTSVCFNELKEKGNRLYKRGRYREAIDIYIEAYSLLKWIEFKDHQNYKVLFQNKTPIIDHQINECQCKEDEQTSYKFSLVNVLLCLSYSYIELRHYSEALSCLNECEDIMPENESFADTFFRKSQARMYNKKSSESDLYLALEDIKKALAIDPNGKIYIEQYQIILSFIENIKAFKKEKIKNAAGYYSTNKSNVLRIKIGDNVLKSSEKQYLVLKEMKMKYEIGLKYYNETNDELQLDFAYKEIENFLEIYQNFKYFYKIDTAKQFDNVLPDIKFEISTMILKNKIEFVNFLEKFKHKMSDSIFQEGNFNHDLIRYAISKVNREKTDSYCPPDLKSGGIEFGKLVTGCNVLKQVNSTSLSLLLAVSLFFLSALFIFSHFYLYVKNPSKFFQTFHKTYFVG